MSVGLVCGVAAPIVAKEGGTWLFAGAVLVFITVGCDRVYALAVAGVAQDSRRTLVFVPLAARITEAAWLYGFWKLGVPLGVVIGAGALSLLHEYLRARGQIAGLREVGISTLGERWGRAGTALVGYGVSGIVALTSSSMAGGLATGILTMAATAWLLLAVLGFVQLAIVMSAALRK
ncbi:MAG: hypothetical protein ACRD0P_16800 [Stackebrandtia sp.]